MACTTKQFLVERGVSLARRTVRQSDEGTCVGRKIVLRGLEWSYGMDGGREKDVNDTNLDQSLRS